MQRHEAEENLRVIRSLMEKATIYRAISAPTALVGGIMSVLMGLVLYLRWRPLSANDEHEFRLYFIIGWGCVLAVTGLANALLLRRDAKRRGERFISNGMKHALLAMLPPMLCGAGLTVFYILTGWTYWLPPMWMLCYALGLLATKGFAPRSIKLLGWTFFAAGFLTLAAFTQLELTVIVPWGWSHLPTSANLAMAATFGLFHLIYAALTWPRGAGKTAAN